MRVALSSLNQSEGWSESEVVVTQARHDPVAEGRAAVPGVVVPAAAAIDALVIIIS